MALHWDLSRIKDQETLCWWTATEDNISAGVAKGEQGLKAVTEALIWHTMGLGLGRITEQNVEEFWLRLQLYEKLHGYTVYDAKAKPRPLTWEEVTAHIGLRTNASTLTRGTWVRKLTNDFMREAERRLFRAKGGK